MNKVWFKIINNVQDSQILKKLWLITVGNEILFHQRRANSKRISTSQKQSTVSLAEIGLESVLDAIWANKHLDLGWGQASDGDTSQVGAGFVGILNYS